MSNLDEEDAAARTTTTTTNVRTDGQEEDGDEATTECAHGLAMESYTAIQLQHATPEHLHITSRRCFIGPIPEAWLSKHRKSWYRYRPSFARYSSRTASFLAAANVANVKNVTGLEGMTGKLPQSFPQPTDVDADVDTPEQAESAPEVGRVEEEGEAPHGSLRPLLPERTHTTSSSPADATQRPSVPRRKSSLTYADDIQRPKSAASNKTRHKKTGSANSSFWWKKASNKESRPAFLRKASGKSVGSLSFVTAAESLDEEHADSEYQALDSQGNEVGPKSYTAVEEPDSKQGDSPSPKVARNPASVKSTAGLLDNAGSLGRASGLSSPEALTPVPTLDAMVRPKTPKSAMKAPGSSAPAPPERSANTEGHDQNVEAVKPLVPATTNLVRFNEPDIAKLRDQEEAAANGDIPKRSIKTSLRRRSSLRAGQLVKAERMLVRVDSTVHELGNDFDENMYFEKEAKAVSKWREFIVACRQTDQDDEADFVIRMYKSRVVPLVEDRQQSKKYLHEIILRKNEVRLNLFSTLDKSIVIWAPWKRFTRIYILKPQSSSDAVQWYHFLRSCLGWKRPPQLTVHVPDLHVTITLDNPFRSRDKKAGKTNASDHFTSEVEGDGGVAKTVILRCLELLAKSSLSGTTDIWREHGDRLGLAWRRYDRLEWVSGVNEENMYGSLAMQASHELEMLPKRHYPTTSKKLSSLDKGLEEPPAVEGFLVRMTSQKGRHKRAGKNFYKKLYFYTSNHLLCFCQPSKAVPPKPPVVAASRYTSAPSAKEVSEQIPLIFGVNPYPLKDGQIEWLDKNDDEKKEYDRRAYEEAERRTNSLLETEAYINLTHIKKVRKAKAEIPEVQPGESSALNDDEDVESEQDDDDPQVDSADAVARSFELTLKNGLTVRLQAYSVTARKEWVKRLRTLIKYWKARIAEDSVLLKGLRQENLQRLQVDEEMEAMIGQYAHKWEVRRSVASGNIWNMCAIASCRSMSMWGVLYRKPRMHGTFQRCNVILSHGKLLVFQSVLRTASGKVQPHIHHERQEVIELEDSYIYSGLITDGDLLYQNQTFSPDHPGHSATPRIYLDDGWTSSDEDTMTCFCLWQGRRKSLFRGIRASDDGNIRSKLRYVSSLGVPGRTIVFKTRSRAERDKWVLSIGLEIERLKRGEAAKRSDIRIIESKDGGT